MQDTPKDITPLPSHRHRIGTGPRRVQRPVYIDRLPPCNHACPAGENIQAWLALAHDGLDRQAWEQLVQDNPFPAVHGRVCYHPCEDACNRLAVDSPVGIHSVERYLGDLAIEEGWPLPLPSKDTGKRVLVVGGGPSGLSAAYHLRRLGHSVEIHEAGPVAGGMIHFGIPAYRMPRDKLMAEIERIEEMGVVIRVDRKVEDLIGAKTAGGFDAVFVAVGAQVGRHTEIPARDAGRVVSALDYLRQVESGNAPQLGRRVAVYGGGNTAMDAARVARRLGADESLVIYRRGLEQAPAHAEEVEEALTEGVKINWLRTIHHIEGTEFTIEKVELDEHGRPQPTGQFETLEADSLILALGQDSDTAFLAQVPGIELKRDGTVVVNERMMTGHPGIFAGGDMVPADRTVTTAVGHGKKAARHIDAWLRGQTYQKPPRHELAAPEFLHIWYQTDAARREQAELDLDARRFGFEEVVKGLSPEEARYEAHRCLSCGNCFECDGCYGACPDDAIIKLGKGLRYRYDYERCTGCAVCFEQCPCGAITMVPEERSTTVSDVGGPHARAVSEQKQEDAA
jgi:NADPH-dependent glutamate synthase beta subunit-like oxidoreductase